MRPWGTLVLAAALLVNVGAWRYAGTGAGSGGVRAGLLDRHSRSRWIGCGRPPYAGQRGGLAAADVGAAAADVEGGEAGPRKRALKAPSGAFPYLVGFDSGMYWSMAREVVNFNTNVKMQGIEIKRDVKMLGIEIKRDVKVLGIELKAELKALSTAVKEVRAEVKALNTELRALDTEVSTEIKALGNEVRALHTEIKALGTEMKAELKALRTDIKALDAKVDGLGTEMKGLDARCDRVEGRTDKVEEKLHAKTDKADEKKLESRIEKVANDSQVVKGGLEKMDVKSTTQFGTDIWLYGVFLTILQVAFQFKDEIIAFLGGGASG